MKKTNKGTLIFGIIFVLLSLALFLISSVFNGSGANDIFSVATFAGIITIFGILIFISFIGFLVSFFISKNNETEETPSRYLLIAKKILIPILIILVLFLICVFFFPNFGHILETLLVK